ncbi:MAG: hypothetical protein AB1716_14295 [Planctomycetota bacterium]
MGVFTRSYNFAFSPREVAEALNISTRSVWDVIRQEQLPIVRLGPRRNRIMEPTLRSYLGLRPEDRLPGALDQIAVSGEQAALRRACKRRRIPQTQP